MAKLLDYAALRSGIAGLAAKIRQDLQEDAFFNGVTGVGTGRDKSSYGVWTDDPIMSDFELELLYANNDLAAVIVEKIVEDALRDGFTVRRTESSPEQDAELSKRVLARWTELQGQEMRFMRGAVWGRLFGGGGLLLNVKGAGGLSSPLDDTKVKSITSIKDVDKQQLQPYTWEPNGDVKTYLWTQVITGFAGAYAAQPVEVHASRFILFPGARTTARKRQENRGWDLSVLQRVRNTLLSFDGMWKNVDAMFADASQAVFHMQGLIQALGEGTGKDDVSIRMAIMDKFRSNNRALIMDAGDEAGNGKEDYKVVDRASLGGLDKVMQNYMIRLATAARMPLTVLLGMAPAGMDATGESDMVLYYNTVDNYRKQVLTERVLRLVKLIVTELQASDKAQLDAALPPVEGEEDLPDEDHGDWEIVWPELSRPVPLDVATAENMRVTSLMAAVVNQVIQPEEAAMALETAAPGLGLRLDMDSRKQALEAAHEEIANREVGLGKMENESEVSTSAAVEVAKSKPAPVPNAANSSKAKQSGRKTPSKAAKRQV
jgi:uncharacterized protein